MHIIINCLLYFAESLSHTPHAAVSDQSFGTAVGIAPVKLATGMGEETKRLDSCTLQVDTPSQ